MQKTVLVVEDDQMIRNLIKVYLEKHDYQVVEAEDGLVAKEVYLSHHPCFIILDLMLPEISGEEFCRWVRDDQGNQEVSIIMLTAKSSSRDKIDGLTMGADHYITKPFNPDELMAHVQALSRRMIRHCEKMTSDGLCLMPRKRQVFLYDQEVDLTKHEFDLLQHLMSHPGTVFTREQLVQALYSHHEQDILDRTIDAHIKKLREKIEETPSLPQKIKTKRGMGYLFADA